MFKKALVYSIIFTVLLSNILPRDVLAQTSYVQEDNTNQDILDLIDSTQEIIKINSDDENIIAKETISVELSDVVEGTIIDTEEKIIVGNTIATSEIYAQGILLLDKESNEFIMDFSTEDENGELVNQTYKVFLTSLSEDEFNATLVNMDTGEILEVDSAELQASVAPVVAMLVSFLVRSGLNWIIKKYGQKAIKAAVKDVSKKIKKKSLGKGSTGRNVPKDLIEEIFMDHVLNDPLNGATEFKSIKLNDSRWHHSAGWVKMERKLKTKEGKNVIIHFVYNKKTKKFDDFKFK